MRLIIIGSTFLYSLQRNRPHNENCLNPSYKEESNSKEKEFSKLNSSSTISEKTSSDVSTIPGKANYIVSKESHIVPPTTSKIAAKAIDIATKVQPKLAKTTYVVKATYVATKFPEEVTRVLKILTFHLRIRLILARI